MRSRVPDQLEINLAEAAAIDGEGARGSEDGDDSRSPLFMGLKRIRRGGNGVFLRVTSANPKLAPQRKGGAKGRSFSPTKPFMAHVLWPVSPTCPPCPHKDVDCYAQGLIDVRRLERLTKGMTGEQVMIAVLSELDAYMDRSSRIPDDGTGRPRVLRLPVSGDFLDVHWAQEFATRETRWRSMGGGRWFGSTQNWKSIPHASFGEIRIFASVSSQAELEAARALGYPPWLTRDVHEGGHRPTTMGSTKILACLAQTMIRPIGGGALRPALSVAADEVKWRPNTCVECRACFDQDLFSRGQGVAFEMHGAAARRRQAPLVQLGRRVLGPPVAAASPSTTRLDVTLSAVNDEAVYSSYTSPAAIEDKRARLEALAAGARRTGQKSVATAARWAAELATLVLAGMVSGKFIDPFPVRTTTLPGPLGGRS